MKNLKCPHCGSKELDVMAGYALGLQCRCIQCKKRFVLVKKGI